MVSDNGVTDDISCLPPHQLPSLESGCTTELICPPYQPRYQPGSPFHNHRKSWPSNITDAQLQSTAQAHIPTPRVSPPSLSAGNDQSLRNNGPSCAPVVSDSGVAPGINYSRASLSVLPSADLIAKQQRSRELESGSNSYDHSDEGNLQSASTNRESDVLHSESGSDSVSQDATHYVDWCNYSPQDSPPLLQSLQVSPTGNIGQDSASLSSSDNPPELLLGEPSLGGEMPRPGTLPATSGSRKRKARNTTTAEKPVKSVAIQIVQEDGLGGSISPSACVPAVARARRNGPLSVDGRRDAAMRRKDKTVCLWCRLAKKKVGDLKIDSRCIGMKLTFKPS